MTAPAPQAPRRDRRWLQRFGEASLRRFGWRIVGELPPLPKFVVVVAPHTSNWDFAVGIAAMFALDVPVHWLGKDSLFRGPLGPAMRALGGRPVRRDSREGLVMDVAAEIRAAPQFVLGLAPEGTRKKVEQWRTGFYRIAEAAGVPIVPVWMDFGRREFGIGAPFHPTGDLAADLAELQKHYRPEMALRREGYWGGAEG
jgi:1-acyl-sn-glycerol-3-phosphate acyltransferase